MKEYRMSVKLSFLSNSIEDRELPLIQIIQEGKYHRTIGIEQLIERIIDVAKREESRPKRISVSRLISCIRRLFPRRWRRRIFNRFTGRNLLFRVQIWNGEESNAPPLIERRRHRRRDWGVGYRVSDKSTTPYTQDPTPSQGKGGAL